MSFLSESGCGTCKLRSKRCDRTWGPAGCRQCAEEGLECRRRIPKLKNSVRNVGAIDNNRPGPTVIPATVASASLSTSQCQANSSPICGDGRSQRQYTGQHPHGSASHGRVYLSSTKSAYTPSTIPNRQAPTPPAEATGSVHKSTSPPSLAIICKTPHVNNSAQLLTPVSPGFSANTNRERGPHAESGPSLIADSHLIYRPGPPPDYEEDDPENIQEVLFSTLSLDRDVESNTVPYVAQSIAIGAIRFVFMPTQLLLRFQGYISQRCSLGREARQRMVLLANVSTAISGTTQYDLKDYRIFHKQLINRIHHARICNDLEKDIALQVLEMSHEVRDLLLSK
ncbi:hypothetical protein RSOLAG1IB_12087 [Rhizoctonia solani AG-1 IB]|uniref:Zn(2)-C6 fungal-type domain-containing protein n=1 Tax=Thanatephorus cucumeris (strain AG1-IB / isolate 7/3/14) TaxID=1108050 RepID=A0A0B7FM17_THACB|nr:hypothetical protein RSOLAG1IB_12087 [Rhizoctonia solani AG-1 IB]